MRITRQEGACGLSGADFIYFGLMASIVAAAISTIGIFTMSMFSGWAQRNGAICSAFAVGLLSVGVLFHLIPEALSLSKLALSWVAAGFMFMVLVGIAVQTAVDRRPDGAALTFGYASIIALAVHSFLDGGIYAASFQEEAFTGWMATGGLLFHEFPEGVIAFALLSQAGIGKLRSLVLAFIAAAVTTISGAVVANIIIAVFDGLPIGAMLGTAAGALIYVLIVHLGPHAAKTPNKRGYDIASLGVIVGTAAIVLERLSGVH
ncbi:ZIP family metal transporter [Hyphococcus flavus]|uniref:ZIP family metal transporter n=1 Tax=Hyphococcus flavus TaxID=1866326 RepID=A0AAE9ZB20_9PROT|nr:ZIP family metal transporter [Hyphococcus flavus]WDI31239.1 ZIP family metal transporter [Hyphococcus flavus]